MSDIKLFAGYYVYFQENLSDSDKITFFNFINEAAENQVLHLLITGKMVSEEMLLKETVGTPEYQGWGDDLQTITQSFSGSSGTQSFHALAKMVVKTSQTAHKAGKKEGMLVVAGIAAASLAVVLAGKVYKN